MFSAEECLDKYISDSEERLNILRAKIDKIPDDIKLAIWGVGHHAAMLMANTNLRKKRIVRVYDSDKRKCGMLFSGNRITPFRYSDLENNLVDGILLTTYTAQKAIQNYLQNMNIPCKIYTLYDI